MKSKVVSSVSVERGVFSPGDFCRYGFSECGNVQC